MTASLGTKIKDPADVRQYGIRWTFRAEGVEIATSEWSVDSDAVTIGTDDRADTFDASSTSLWLSGGVHDANYTVTNRITTNQTPAETIERSFLLRVRDL